MHNLIEPVAIELFSGAGGLSLGLHMAGWKTIFANDFDSWATKTYKQNFPNTEVVLGDIKAINFQSFRGATLVAGGPPCQPFSVAGKQNANFDPRDMMPEFIRAVSEIKPIAFLLENVPGLVTPKHKDYLNWVLNSLIQLGYSVQYKILDAADFGVPQHRKRLIVVGVISGYTFNYPKATHGPNGKLGYITAGMALTDVPSDDPNVAKVIYAKSPIYRPSPYAGMLVNGQGRPINLNRPSQTIPATAGGYRTHFIDHDNTLLEYHAYLKAGGVPKSGEVKGARRITTKESARLQSFPDDFVFLGPKSTRYKLIGNAVPPLLAKAIGTALYECIFLNVNQQKESVISTQLRLQI